MANAVHWNYSRFLPVQNKIAEQKSSLLENVSEARGASERTWALSIGIFPTYFFTIAAKHTFTSQACGKKLARKVLVDCTCISLNQVYGKRQ